VNASAGTSDPLLPATRARCRRVVAQVQSEYRLPSLVAGVVRSGRLVWWDACGEATGGPAPGPDLQYRIGSLTKMVTAVAVLQCRDDGLVDLDEPVARHSPGAPFGDTTLRRVLSHAGGLPAEPEGPWWERHDDADLDALFTRVGRQRLVVAPGSRQHYSNLGYALAGAVVAAVRGAGWERVVRDRVLVPLGMTRTTYGPTRPHARGWSVHPYRGRLEPEPHTDTGAMAPAGQLWSTLADLARFAVFLTDPAAHPAVLDAASVREMTTGHSAEPGTAGTAYGLGVQVDAGPHGPRLGHGGSMPGFLAALVAEPSTELAAVAMANGTAGAAGSVPGALLDAVAEAEPTTPPPWRPEPEVAGADELLGPWFWGNTPFTLVVRDGWLRLEHAGPGRTSRFEPRGPDAWRGLDAYFAGERLRVVRDAAGGVARLELATYELTREPYGG